MSTPIKGIVISDDEIKDAAAQLLKEMSRQGDYADNEQEMPREIAERQAEIYVRQFISEQIANLLRDTALYMNEEGFECSWDIECISQCDMPNCPKKPVKGEVFCPEHLEFQRRVAAMVID